MSDDEHGLVRHLPQVGQQTGLCGLVQCAGGFVQQQHGAVGEDGPGDGDTLELALGQTRTPLTNGSVQSLLQRGGEIVGTGNVQRPQDAGFIVGGGGVGEGYDLADGAAEQVVALGHVGEQAAPAGVQGAVAIGAPQKACAAVQRVDAHQQLQDGTLAAAGGAGEGDAAALIHSEVQVGDSGRRCLIAAAMVGEAGIMQTKGAQLLLVEAMYLQCGDGGDCEIVREVLRLPQALGAGQHGVEAGKVAGEVGEGSLYLGDELLHGGEHAVAHGAVEDAAAAVDDTYQQESVHGGAEAHVAQVREPCAGHAGLTVGVHAGIGVRRYGLLASEDTDYQQAGQAILQVDTETAVCLLYPFMQALEGTAEHGGQQGQYDACRQDDGGQPRLHAQQHRRRSNQADQHARGIGNYLSQRVRRHGGIRGKAIQPLAGVHGGYGGVVLSQQRLEQAGLEAVFQRSAGVLTEVAVHRAENDLESHQAHQPDSTADKGLGLAGGGRVDQRPQDQRVAYAAQGQNRLYRQQQGGEVSGTARHRGDPTDDAGCRRSRTGHSIPPQNGLDRQKAVGTTAKCTYATNYTVQGGPRQVIWGQEGDFGVCG